MLIEKEKIIAIIMESVTEIANEWGINCELPLLAETKIWGGGSAFDSMNIVNITVRIEEKIADSFDLQITIADEKALSQNKSPFRTVESLTNYLVGLVSEV